MKQSIQKTTSVTKITITPSLKELMQVEDDERYLIYKELCWAG